MKINKTILQLINFVNRKKPNKFVKEMKENETPTEINFEDLVIENEKSLLGNEEVVINFEDIPNEEDETKKVAETENKNEEGTKTLTTTETKKDKVEEQTELTSFSGTAKKLLKKGDWQDVLIQGEDGKEVKLSEVDNLDEETFLSIWEEQKKFSTEELKDSYIPIKGIDDNKKRIINIVANGGDLTEIFKTEAQMKKPYEGLDLENQQVQQNIVFQQYLRQGLTQEEAKQLVLNSTKDLTLDKKASFVVDENIKAYDQALAKIEEDLIETRKKEQESIKVYKKSLVDFYKQEELEDTIAKPLIKAATEYNSDGQLYIDSVYDEMMKDPEKAKDLVFFMLEKDKFLAKKGVIVKRDTQIKNMRTIKLVSDTSKNENRTIEAEEKNDSPFADVVIE